MSREVSLKVAYMSDSVFNEHRASMYLNNRSIMQIEVPFFMSKSCKKAPLLRKLRLSEGGI